MSILRPKEPTRCAVCAKTGRNYYRLVHDAFARRPGLAVWLWGRTICPGCAGRLDVAEEQTVSAAGLRKPRT
jgi:hypothetical protein